MRRLSFLVSSLVRVAVFILVHHRQGLDRL